MRAYIFRNISSTLWKLRFRHCATASQHAFEPLSILKSKRHYFVHFGNALVLAAINQKDMLNLRAISVAASTFGVFYNLLQPIPLIAPACWGVFFIGCHFYYIMDLMRERQDVVLSTEAELIFEASFKPHGFTKRHFLDILEHAGAKWRTFCKGDMIHNRGDPLDDLSYLYEGKAQAVSSTGDWMRDVVPGRSAWLGEFFDPKRNREVYWSQQRFFPISYKCIAEQCRTLNLQRRPLDDFLSSSPKLACAATGTQVSDLWGKNLSSLRQNRLLAYHKMVQVATSNGIVSLEERLLLDDWRLRHNIKDEDHAKVLEEIGWSAEEFEKGRSDKSGVKGIMLQWLSAKASMAQSSASCVNELTNSDMGMEINAGSLRRKDSSTGIASTSQVLPVEEVPVLPALEMPGTTPEARELEFRLNST